MALPVVRDYMATDLHCLQPELSIFDAIGVLLDQRVSGAPVTDASGKLVGILSEKDCLQLLAKGKDHDIPSGSVGEYMSSEVATVPPDMDIYFAAGKFLGSPYRRFPVIENGELIGQLSRRDILRAIRENLNS